MKAPKTRGPLLARSLNTLAFVICAAGTFHALSVAAQSTLFRNLDFEEGQIVPLPLPLGSIDPALAFPSWTLSGVKNGNEPFQVVAMADTESVDGAYVALLESHGPFEGSFMAALRNSLFGGEWEVRLSQTGLIPEGTQFITFLTTTPSVSGSVSINDVTLSLSAEGGRILGDVSTFAGQSVQLTLHGSMDIDDIQFVPAPIPEPGTAMFVTLICLVLEMKR